MRRLWLFVYGLPNIFGAVLGLVGLALLFTGFIRSFWPFIVLGLYGIGYLSAPRPHGFESGMGDALDISGLTDKLNRMVAAGKTMLPPDAAVILEDIGNSLLDIMNKASTPELSAFQLQVARQTANDYLPRILDTFARLPPTFARLHPIRDGKTARQILKDQLVLLDRELKRIVVDLHQADSEALIVHGEFLKKKFQSSEL